MKNATQTTNNGKKGGLLKGKPHYDKKGKPLGGIKAVVTDSGQQVELEGGEVIINKEASKKHWKELSRINQSAGNGVPILPPDDSDSDIDTDEFEKGGKIDFNPNKVPSRKIYNYAKKIKEKYPKVWGVGGNIFGNEAYKNLERVLKRGYWLDSEEWMYKKWQSFNARHSGDIRIAGIIANLKWLNVVDKGWQYMTNLIDEEIDKKYGDDKMAKGGKTEMLSLQGTFISKDKKTKLEYKKVGDNYEFSVFGGESNPVENYTRTQFKKRNGNSVVMSYQQFINFLYNEGFIDDKMAKGGDIGRIKYSDLKVRSGIGARKKTWEVYCNKIDNVGIYFQDFYTQEEAKKDYFENVAKDYKLAKGGVVTYKEKYNKKYGYKPNESHTLDEVSNDTGVSKKGVQQIYNKGIGAYKTNPESVRPNVKSKEQWAMARVYSAVMGGKASRVDANELKMEKGGNINQKITCENCGWTWNTKDSAEFDKYICHRCNFDNSGFYAKGGELAKGIKTEREHIKTIEDTYNRKISPNQAIKRIASDHLKEDANYYSKLNKMENKMAKGGKTKEVSPEFQNERKGIADFITKEYKLNPKQVLQLDRSIENFITNNKKEIDEITESKSIEKTLNEQALKNSQIKQALKTISEVDSAIPLIDKNEIQILHQLNEERQLQINIIDNEIQYNFFGELGLYIKNLQASASEEISSSDLKKIIQNPNFKLWFGSSQVITDNGLPRIVYHGSSGLQYEFNEFKFSPFPAVYFAENKSYAEWFQKIKGGNNVLFKCFLKVERPLDLTIFVIDPIKYFDLKTYIKLRYNYELPNSTLCENLAPQPIWHWLRFVPDFLKDLIDRNDYDGVHYYENNPQDIIDDGQENITKAWLVFKGENIKSADYRNLTFSQLTKNITLEKGGKLC